MRKKNIMIMTLKEQKQNQRINFKSKNIEYLKIKNEDGELHKIRSTLFLNTEKYSSEDMVVFSDDRDNGKVKLKQYSNGKLILFNKMITIITEINHHTF